MADPIEPEVPNDYSNEEREPYDGKLSSKVVRAMGGKRSFIVGVCVFTFVAILALAANLSHKPTGQAQVASVSNIDSTQAEKPVSQAYASDLNSQNQAEFNQAIKTGGTTIPTPFISAPPTSSDPAPSDVQGAPPVVEFSPQSDVTPPASPAADVVTPAPQAQTQTSTAAVAPAPVFDKDAESAMLAAMRGLTAGPSPGATVVATDLAASEGQGGDVRSGNAGGSIAGDPDGSNSSTSNSEAKAAALVPAAGTILYARMIGELNSDAPGPAIATIVAGPLSGARVLGEFQSERAGLVIKFTTMTVPASDGSGTETTPINAEAVSADALTSGMATSINNHLLSNLGVTFVAGFAQGFGQAISQSGSTTTVSGSGLATISNPALSLSQELAAASGTAAGAAGGEFQQLYGNRPPTIKLAAGTPFALVFLGTAPGVTNAQTQLQTVNSQQPESEQQQKLTPTLPARSNYSSVIGYPAQNQSSFSN